MMKMNWKKRALLFALSLVLLLPLLSVSVFADEDGELVEWELSEDELTIFGNGKEYSVYVPMSTIPFYREPKQVYTYANSVSFSEDGPFGSYISNVHAPGPDSEFIWLYVKDGFYIFATEVGTRQLNAFLNGKTDNYFLRIEEGKSEALEPSVFEAMEKARAEQDNKKTVEVSGLRSALRFEVILYDETQTFAYAVGAVYRLEDGKDYYLHYLSLGNQHFDADGNFSYRSGSVELTALDADLSTELDAVAEKIVYKSPVYLEEAGSSVIISETSFWILYVIISVVIFVTLLLPGLLLSRSKKKRPSKYWRILCVIALVWIFLAILLMILLI